MPSNNGYQQLNSSHNSNFQTSVMLNSSAPRPLSYDEVCSEGVPPPPLQISDKVVWLSDNGPEYGIVKWLGKLPDVGNDWMAGVDFINPVGTGTGLYNDHKLFETKVNHASLVPIVGLMKATDFLGKSNIEDTIPPQKPKRTKQKSSDTFKFYTEKLDSSLGSSKSISQDGCNVESPKYSASLDNAKTSSDLQSINSHKKGL